MERQKIKFKQTEIGKIPEDWEIVNLGIYCSKIGSGITPRGGKSVYSNKGVSLIRSQNVYNNGFNQSGLAYINKKYAQDMKNVTVILGDILLNITGDSVARCCMVPKEVIPARVNQHVAIIRVRGGFDPYFVRYYLTNKRMQSYLLSLADSGGTRKALTKSMIEKLKIPKPARIEQKAIAKILSDLDAKIELNQQMNKTLEAIGQALFKRWFVDFEFPDEKGRPYKSSGGKMVDSELGEIPERYKVESLRDISDLTMGQSPKGESYNLNMEGESLLNGAADFEGNTIRPKKYTTSPIKMCRQNDMIFCIRATIGNILFADQAYCLGRGVAALTPISNKYREFLFYSLGRILRDLIKAATGSVIVGLLKDDIERYKILIPSEDILNNYHKSLVSLFLQIEKNVKQNQKLVKIRDLLLPKLMSGEIRVPVGK